MATLTAEERDFLAAQLRQSSSQFLEAIAGLPPEQWSFRPSEDVWSVQEIADHVVVVEQRIFKMIQKILRDPAQPEKAAGVAGKERKLMRAVLDRSTRVKVPEPMEPTGQAETPEQIAALFQQVRAKTLDYVRDTADPLHHHFAPHFVLKDLDGAQWLLMIALHTSRHVQQIDEVKAHAAYPGQASQAAS
ncbi:MAG: DinB family protein [Bryobacteraceae bacterium]|nr:DinB family protein [Bryobacteraceae bacterium]